MRVVMLKKTIATCGLLEEGVEYELHDSFAQSLIISGIAKLAKAEVQEEAQDEPEKRSNTSRGKKPSSH